MSGVKIHVFPDDIVSHRKSKAGNDLYFRRCYVEGVGDYKMPIPIELLINDPPKPGTYSFPEAGDLLRLNNGQIEFDTFGVGDKMLKMSPAALPEFLKNIK